MSISPNQARINRAAFAWAAALALAACGEAPTRREAFMRECIEGHNPVDCADAADRIWPLPAPPTTVNTNLGEQG